MRIVSWNINSLRLRLPLVEKLNAEVSPDILCLQETKVPDEAFPMAGVQALGYAHVLYRGMKSYNGVAILSKLPIEDAGSRDWCGRQDCRHVAARLKNGLEIHNFYVPAGGDEPDPEVNEKFAHKLEFMAEMADWWRKRASNGAKAVLLGDLNVAPLETDVWSHKQLLKIVSHTPVEVEHLKRVMDAHGWIDAVRRFVPPEEKLYSWWSYRSRDWRKGDRGRRLDHIWVTPALDGCLRSASVLKDVRDWERPSDHAPVVVDIKL
ncbi:MAG: exodeoxyribonuclease III [Alphaproteobacteria bacterium]